MALLKAICIGTNSTDIKSLKKNNFIPEIELWWNRIHRNQSKNWHRQNRDLVMVLWLAQGWLVNWRSWVRFLHPTRVFYLVTSLSGEPSCPSWLQGSHAKVRQWLRWHCTIIIITFWPLIGTVRKPCLSTFRIILPFLDSIRIVGVTLW